MAYQQQQVQPANVPYGQGPMQSNPQQAQMQQQQMMMMGANPQAAAMMMMQSVSNKIETQDQCPKGHAMMLYDYQGAYMFLAMHTTVTTTRHSRRGRGGRTTTTQAPMACGGCYFNLLPNEKVLICETCVVGGQQTHTARVFCETCVSTGNHRRPPRADWSTGLCACGQAPGAFVDALLCWPCKAAGLATFMQIRHDGKAPGEDTRCVTHCQYWQMGCMDACFGGLIGACVVGTLYQQAAIKNFIEPYPQQCNACCCAWFCRCCMLAQIHREFLTRKEELGEPMGCLCNCSGEPVKRKPYVAYTRAGGGPAAMMAMGQQMMPQAPFGQQQQQGPWGQPPQQQQQQGGWGQPQQQQQQWGQQ